MRIYHSQYMDFRKLFSDCLDAKLDNNTSFYLWSVGKKIHVGEMYSDDAVCL